MAKFSERVSIGSERYKDLLAAEKKLIALENAGVDNWEWYGDAMSELFNSDEETEEEIYG